MARKARNKSKREIYNIMMRRIDRQRIFKEEEDYISFIDVIKK